MTRFLTRPASASLPRVLRRAAVLCFAAAVAFGATSASAQGACIWSGMYGHSVCPAGVTPVWWTAIAFSTSTMHSGASNGQASQKAAEDLAMSNCRLSPASDCRLVLSGSDECLALATSPPDLTSGWAHEPDRIQAAALALAECRENHGDLCMVQAAQCAGDDGRFPPPSLALKPRPGDDPIVGCFQWFNGAPVYVLPNNKLVSGPFTATWAAVDPAQRAYSITWPQSTQSNVTISDDGQSLSGTNQNGGKYTARRVAGGGSLIGVWNWNGVVPSKVTVLPTGTSTTTGTFTAVSSSATWHGTWASVGGSSRLFTLSFSDPPVDKVTLSADGSRVSGADQFGIAVSGTRSSTCPVN